uniref:Placenta associated 9 n=1 Tax=Theropithecus gelada TaxID=9565 RepID=A0A8D2FF18_THEGE
MQRGLWRGRVLSSQKAWSRPGILARTESISSRAGRARSGKGGCGQTRRCALPGRHHAAPALRAGRAGPAPRRGLFGRTSLSSLSPDHPVSPATAGCLQGLHTTEPFSPPRGDSAQSTVCDRHMAVQRRLDVMEEMVEKTVDHLGTEVKGLLGLLEELAWNLPPGPFSPAPDLLGEDGF